MPAPPSDRYTHGHSRRVTEYAQAEGWPLLDLFTPLVGRGNSLHRNYEGNEIWPNPEGYGRLTEALCSLVDSLALGSRPAEAVAEREEEEGD